MDFSGIALLRSEINLLLIVLLTEGEGYKWMSDIWSLHHLETPKDMVPSNNASPRNNSDTTLSDGHYTLYR